MLLRCTCDTNQACREGHPCSKDQMDIWNKINQHILLMYEGFKASFGKKKKHYVRHTPLLILLTRRGLWAIRLPATRGESISFGPTFEDGQFSLFCMQSMVRAKKNAWTHYWIKVWSNYKTVKILQSFYVYVLFYVLWTRNRWIQTNCRTRASFSGPLMFYRRYLLADVSALGSWPFFLFQENLQLALCVELHPRIQAGQALRKENSCQTMNYCAVTRQVPFRGVDEEAGSVSRITHSHAVSRVLNAHAFACGCLRVYTRRGKKKISSRTAFTIWTERSLV